MDSIWHFQTISEGEHIKDIPFCVVIICFTSLPFVYVIEFSFSSEELSSRFSYETFSEGLSNADVAYIIVFALSQYSNAISLTATLAVSKLLREEFVEPSSCLTISFVSEVGVYIGVSFVQEKTPNTTSQTKMDVRLFVTFELFFTIIT